jgi:nucleotide-binding universal stress UspA family protein
MDASADTPQLPLKSVIYATDFSPCSEKAGDYATLLAKRFDAELIAAHAFVLTHSAMEVEAAAGPQAKSSQRKDLERALAEAAQQYGKGVRRTSTALVEGDPREAIPRLAAEHAPSLIVLGTKGRGRLDRTIVGSAAERILRATNGPSLTVGPTVPACDPERGGFRRILYATGLSAVAARGATYAVAMAKAFDATLEVLHVVRPDDQADPVRFSEVKKEFEAIVGQLVPNEADTLIRPRALVEVGTAHTRILEHLRNDKDDLLVLSIRKSSHLWLQSRLSGAFHIIANAPCPVMTMTG